MKLIMFIVVIVFIFITLLVRFGACKQDNGAIVICTYQ